MPILDVEHKVHFDHVYLPLKVGRNELWVAVSEDFGGWGITGMFEDMTGITMVP